MSLVPVREEVLEGGAPLRHVNRGGPDADALCHLLDQPACLGFWEQAEGWHHLPAISSARILGSTADLRPRHQEHQDLKYQRVLRCIADDCR